MILDSFMIIPVEIFVIILFVLVIALIVVVAIIARQLQNISRKYYALTSGKKVKDLEEIILARFEEMDKVKARMKRYHKDHKTFKGHLDSCYNKMGLVKYDAFDSMAGELSFSLALLNDDNSGLVLTSMHSKQGCFTYAKEIIKGESYIALSSEEKEAIKKAKTIDEEIEALTNEPDDEDIM